MRGCLVVAFAYLFAFQTLLSGIVSDRMALADPLSGAVICSQDPGAVGPAKNGASGTQHAICDFCAFHSLAPLAPERPQVAPVTTLVVWTTAPGRKAFALASRERYEPRTSQGPPHAA